MSTRRLKVVEGKVAGRRGRFSKEKREGDVSGLDGVEMIAPFADWTCARLFFRLSYI